jgi:hypothetical protein
LGLFGKFILAVNLFQKSLSGIFGNPKPLIFGIYIKKHFNAKT